MNENEMEAELREIESGFDELRLAMTAAFSLARTLAPLDDKRVALVTGTKRIVQRMRETTDAIERELAALQAGAS